MAARLRPGPRTSRSPRSTGPVGCSDLRQDRLQGPAGPARGHGRDRGDRAPRRRARVRDQTITQARHRRGHAHAARRRPAQGRCRASPRSTRSSASSPDGRADRSARTASTTDRGSSRPPPGADATAGEPTTSRADRGRGATVETTPYSRRARGPACAGPTGCRTGLPPPPAYPAPACPAPTSDTAVPDARRRRRAEASAPTPAGRPRRRRWRPRRPPRPAAAPAATGAPGRPRPRSCPRPTARARADDRARPAELGADAGDRGASLADGRAVDRADACARRTSHLADALDEHARARRLRPAPDHRRPADRSGSTASSRPLDDFAGAHAAGDPASHVRDPHPDASGRSSRRTSSSTSPTRCPAGPASG